MDNDWKSIASALEAVSNEASNKNLCGVLRLLSEDLIRFYEHIKQTWLVFLEDKDSRVSHFFNLDAGSPFLPGEYVRPFVGEDVAVALLEFYRGGEFSKSFDDRLNVLHEQILSFVRKLCTYGSIPKEKRDLTEIFALDEERKELGTCCRTFASYIELIAQQLDVPRQETWVGPKSPSEWEKIFGVTWETIKRRIKSGQVVAEQLNSKSWRIRADHVPT